MESDSLSQLLEECDGFVAEALWGFLHKGVVTNLPHSRSHSCDRVETVPDKRKKTLVDIGVDFVHPEEPVEISSNHIPIVFITMGSFSEWHSSESDCEENDSKVE